MLFLSFLFLIAQSTFALPLTARDLHTGDVLLQSVPCYLCTQIELEEGLPYSHSGVVIKEKNQVSVLESWNNVQKISLTQHLSLRKKNTTTLVLRPIRRDGSDLRITSVALQRTYDQFFVGHHYDDAFLWNNQDSAGELFYCSEMTAKLLNYFLPIPFATKPMHYTQYREDWIRYFNGTPPDGQPGISPADFARSPLLKNIGEL